MAYNHAPYGSQAPPFFNDNISQDDLLAPDELDLNGSWPTQIDPALQNLPMSASSLPPMTYQVQQQVHFQSQEYQQQPIQRYFNEPERSFFEPAPAVHGGQVFGLSQPGAPIQPLPQAALMRLSSPSLSQGLSSATSAQSPDTEFDLPYSHDYSGQGSMDFFKSSPPDYTYADTHYEPGTHYQLYSLPRAQGNSCVNMSQVQGFADPQEVTFEADEGYDAMAMKVECVMEHENHHIKNEIHHPETQEYHYLTDEALGSSIKDATSPENTSTPSIHLGDEVTSEIDAEGEADNGQEMIEPDDDADDDTEYRPRSTRTRKRTLPHPNNNNKSAHPYSTTTKRGSGSNRITKSIPSTKTKSQHHCKSCSLLFKDALLLSRHIASAHTRAFICVFSFAGCNSTFASKNEWKRHVSSQHLNLTAWVCELGACASSKSSGFGSGTEFNRKDLFTQHLRRMHAPSSLKRKKEKVGLDERWEKELKELQVSCLKVKRQPPNNLRCPLTECGIVFEGTNCWDERMEHVGKHLEKAAQENFGVDQGADELLVHWAQRERIVEPKPGGGFRLVIGKKDDDDLDAEGEME